MVLPISAFYFFYFAVIGVYVIFMPKVLATVGYEPAQIGVVFAAAPLVRFAVPFAFIKGLKLTRTVFNAALVLMIASVLAYFPALHSFGWLVLVNVLFGIGLSLILPFVEVIVLEHIGKERYGKVRLFGSIGFIVVALVLVRFLSSPQVALSYLAATTIATALFGYGIAARDHRRNSAQGISETAVRRFSLRRHAGLWAGILLMQISFGPFYNFFTIYETDHGIGMDTTIYLWSFGVVAEIVLFYFQGPLLRRNLHRLLEFAALVTAFRWALVWLFPDNLLVLFAAQSLHAVSFALFHTAAISHLYALYSEKKLAQQFFFGISYGLGGFLGAVGAGYVYQYWPSALFLAAALTALGAFAALRKG